MISNVFLMCHVDVYGWDEMIILVQGGYIFYYVQPILSPLMIQYVMISLAYMHDVKLGILFVYDV